MVTENNSQLNAFGGGMDSDSSYQSIENGKYTYGKNIRTVSYNQPGGNSNTNTESQVRVIDGLKECSCDILNVERILATEVIRDYGIIIYVSKDEDLRSTWKVARFKNTNTLDGEFKDVPNYDIDHLDGLKTIFRSGTETSKNRFSTTTRFEDDDVIKLYIADGEHYLMILNISPSKDSYNNTISGRLDYILAYPLISYDVPQFIDLVEGQMKPGLVQYSYQLYDKNGVSTEISPTTKLIPIAQYDSRYNVNTIYTRGFLKEEYTGVGVKLKLRFNMSQLDLFAMSRMYMYRITYTESGQPPLIEKIYDGSISSLITDGTVGPDGYTTYDFVDIGYKALDTMTAEEYNASSGVHIIPESIDDQQDYLFAANIKESSSWIKEVDLEGISVTPYLVISKLVGDGSANHNGVSYLEDYTLSVPPKYAEYNKIIHGDNDTERDIDFLYAQKFSDNIDTDIDSTNVHVTNYEQIIKGIYKYNLNPGPSEPRLVHITNMSPEWEKLRDSVKSYFMNSLTGQSSFSYTDPKICHYVKSLRRGEQYSYGIVFYNKYGEASLVKFIGDIEIPELYEDGFQTFQLYRREDFSTGKYYMSLEVNPMGVIFDVDFSGISQDIREKIVAYEFVRIRRTSQTARNISQGVISRLSSTYVLTDYTPGSSRDVVINYNGTEDYTPTNLNYGSAIFTPMGLLTTSNFIDYSGVRDGGEDIVEENTAVPRLSTNIYNNNIFLYVSPETSYTKDSISDLIRENNTTLNPLLYLYSGYNCEKDNFKIHGKSIIDHDPVTKIWYRPYEINCHNSTATSNLASSNIDTAAGSHTSWECVFKNGSGNYVRAGRSEDGEYDPDLYLNYMTENNMLLTLNGDGMIYDQDSISFNGYKFKDAIIQESIENDSFLSYYKINDFSYLNDIPNKYLHTIYMQNASYKDCSDFSLDTLTGDNADLHNEAGKHRVIEIAPYAYHYCKLYLQDRNTITQEEHNNKYIIKNYIKSNELLWNLFMKNNSENNKPIFTEYEQTIGSYIFNNICLNSSYRLFANETGLNSSKLHVLPTANGGSSFVFELSGSENSPITKSVVGTSDNTYKMIGTYLCNVRNDNPGYLRNNSTIVTDVFNSYGNYYKYDPSVTTVTSTVFDGDTFIVPFEYVAAHKHYWTYAEGLYMHPTYSLIYSIPVETNINTFYSKGNEFSKKRENTEYTNVQIEASKVKEYLTQEEPLYSYNSAYSTNDTIKEFSSAQVEEASNDLNVTDYRTYYSLPKLNKENTDNWTKFLAANYIDVASKYGPITDIKSFNSELLFWQKNAFGKFGVNERSLVTDDNNTAIALGTGGILSRYDYLDQTSGMAEDQHCKVCTPNTLYWWDDYNQEIKVYASNVNPMSLTKTRKVQNLVHQYADANKIPSMFYDKKNNEIVSNVLKDSAIVYNEKINGFSSIYDVKYQDAISFEDKIYLVSTPIGENKVMNLGQWNCYDHTTNRPMGFDGQYLETKLEYVVNDKPIITKVFDSQEIIGNGNESGSNIKDSDAFFANSHNYTWKTNLNDAEFDSSQSGIFPMTLREGNYRYTIPRHNDSLYGDRIRGKYMICSIEDKEPKIDASISYIVTKFRASWI